MSIATKLEHLNDTKTGIKNALNTYFNSEIQVDDTFRSYVNKINTIYDNWPKITEEGTVLSLNSTKKGKMEIELKPSALGQASTSGRNILNPAWWNNSSNLSSVQNDSIFTITTKNGAGRTSVSVDILDLLQANVGKTLAWTYKSIDISQYSSSSTTIAMLVYRLQGDTTDRYGCQLTTTTKNDFTIPENLIFAKLFMYGNNTNTALTSDNIVVFDELMLQINNTISEEWEPYTGGQSSPSPSYSQTIHTISGDNNIKVENKNLAKGNFNSKLWISSKVVVERDTALVGQVIKVKSNTNYTLSGTFSSFGDSVIRWAFFENYPQINNTVNTIYYTSTSKTFTTPNNANYILLYNTFSRNTTVSDISLCETQFASTYVPHQEQNFPITLPVENLFDKNNTNILNNYFSVNGEIKSAAGTRLIYIPCKTNTTYTISKRLSERFSIAYTKELPQTGIQTYGGVANNSATSLTITTGNDATYLIAFIYLSTADTLSLQEILDSIQIEKDTKANTYQPYGTTSIEYCKIGDYEDVFFKNVVGSTYYDSNLELDKWYLKKKIGKTIDIIGSMSKNISDMISDSTVYSYCGGTVSGTTITYTSALTVDNTIYYPLSTATDILLNNTIQTQLNNIIKAINYQEQTNVSQTNNDLPFIINASALKYSKSSI